MDKNKEQYYLKNVLDQTEQKDVNNLLSGDLKDIFNHVQNECKDFKENVFLKLVDHLDNTMVRLYFKIYNYILIGSYG